MAGRSRGTNEGGGKGGGRGDATGDLPYIILKLKRRRGRMRKGGGEGRAGKDWRKGCEERGRREEGGRW